MYKRQVIDFLTEKIGIETKVSLRRKKMEKSISEINEIKESVNEVKELMTRHIEKDKERTVVTLRSNIWQMHGEFMKQGFVTKDGLEVFSEACTVSYTHLGIYSSVIFSSLFKAGLLFGALIKPAKSLLDIFSDCINFSTSWAINP